MRKLDVWHTLWLLALVVGLVILGIGFWQALAYRDVGETANFSSIWGLWVTLIGFGLTIYTMIETQRAARKAQREVQAATLDAQQKIETSVRQAEEAVKNAQEQTRQVLERVRHSVRAADFSTLLMWVRDLRTAASGGDWHRALLLAEECPALAERLRNAEGLEESERQGLREGADNLRLVQAYVRNNRLTTPTQTTGLAANHAKNVEALAALLEQLGGRLYHELTKGATL